MMLIAEFDVSGYPPFVKNIPYNITHLSLNANRFCYISIYHTKNGLGLAEGRKYMGPSSLLSRACLATHPFKRHWPVIALLAKWYAIGQRFVLG